MKEFQITEKPNIICGGENNVELFLRKVIFPKGYTEEEFHKHTNSFEYYFILKGKAHFANEGEEISAKVGSILYFAENELHKIVSVEDDIEMILIKKANAIKG